MLGFGDYLWRPRRLFKSVGDWADASGNSASLLALPTLPPKDGAEPETNPGRWHVASLSQGKVIGDVRLIATRDNDVLGQLQSLHGIDAPAEHWSLRQWRWRQPRQLAGTAAVIAAAAGTNYYHWLFDSLPRLHLLRLAGTDWQRVDSFLINGPVRSFDVESLEWLGIPPARVVRCSKRQVTMAERLLVPPMPTLRQGAIERWMCEFLRNSFLAAVRPTAAGTRLYLSRRSSPKRRLANEAEIEDWFQRHGFQSIRLEELSFREQVETFAGAGFVAGPHGAGFANLVFAPAGTRVLEFFHPQHQAGNYAEIARLSGMNYRRVIGEAPREVGGELSEKLGAFTVSLPQLQAALSELDGD